jgi:hypothetical protein
MPLRRHASEACFGQLPLTIPLTHRLLKRFEVSLLGRFKLLGVLWAARASNHSEHGAVIGPSSSLAASNLLRKVPLSDRYQTTSLHNADEARPQPITRRAAPAFEPHLLLHFATNGLASNRNAIETQSKRAIHHCPSLICILTVAAIQCRGSPPPKPLSY